MNLLNNHELAYIEQLISAPLVKPLSHSHCRQCYTVFLLPSIRLGGDLCFPIVIANAAACHVHPFALHCQVIDAKPNFHLIPQGLPHIVIESIIFITCLWCTEGATLGNAIFIGLMIGLSMGKSQDTF